MLHPFRVLGGGWEDIYIPGLKPGAEMWDPVQPSQLRCYGGETWGPLNKTQFPLLTCLWLRCGTPLGSIKNTLKGYNI